MYTYIYICVCVCTYIRIYIYFTQTNCLTSCLTNWLLYRLVALHTSDCLHFQGADERNESVEWRVRAAAQARRDSRPLAQGGPAPSINHIYIYIYICIYIYIFIHTHICIYILYMHIYICIFIFIFIFSFTYVYIYIHDEALARPLKEVYIDR